VFVGTVFFVLSTSDPIEPEIEVYLTQAGIVGLSTSSTSTIDLSYDVLGLEALFLVPRICSLLSLNPYFGTLVSLMNLVHVVLILLSIELLHMHVGFSLHQGQAPGNRGTAGDL